MDLRHLNDQTLLKDTAAIAATDHAILVRLLYHLLEVDRRRLFSSLKLESMQEYVMTCLKYAEDEAIRRLQAMKLLKSFKPEQQAALGDKITNGGLSLTNICLAQTLFNHEKRNGREMNADQRWVILTKFDGCSTRKAKKIAREYSPGFKKVKELHYDQIEDDVLREKLLRVRGKYAHSRPNLTLQELLHLMCDNELAENKPRTKPTAAPRDASRQEDEAPPKTAAQTSREVWQRDHSRCTNCGSYYAIQEDHRNPKGNGGTYTTENMRLLCRNCNQRAAIKFYGQGKMDSYLKSPITPYGLETG